MRRERIAAVAMRFDGWSTIRARDAGPSRRRRNKFVETALIWAILALVPVVVDAEPDRAPAEAPADAASRPIVALLITPGESGGTDGDILDAVRAQLGDLPVELVVEAAPGFPPTLPAQIAVAAEFALRACAGTVFWLDQSVQDRVFVYLAEQGGTRLLMRSVDSADTAERVESVAVIVRGLVQSILAGGTIGVSVPGVPDDVEPEPTVTAVPAEEAPIAPAPLPWLGLQLAYSVDFFSAEATALHGLDAGVVFHVHENWSVFAAYRVSGDAEVSGGGIELGVGRHPLEVGVRFRWPIDDWDFGASLFGVVDLLTPKAGSREAGMVAAPSADAWMGGMGFLVHGSYRVFGDVRIFFDGGVDVWFNPLDFAAETGDGQVVLLGTRTFVPRLLLGLWVDLL